MNLYEVIFWGADGQEDLIYLVRATDWRTAVSHVRINASPAFHKVHKSTLAHRVHEIGTDCSTRHHQHEQILRGPYFHFAYNHGWRAWSRQSVGSDCIEDWLEETPPT